MKFMKPLKKMCLFIVLAIVFFFAKGFTAAIVLNDGHICDPRICITSCI